MLRPSYRVLSAECRNLRRENGKLLRENTRLVAENAALKKQIAKLEVELEAAGRARKRQAAPFSHGPPKKHPAKPGRKAGARYGKAGHRPPPPPKTVDERYDVPLPKCCPKCGSTNLRETRVATQYQVDIPRRPVTRRFDIHLGACDECGKAVHGRHELQTSDAVGAAASQLGPGVHAAIAVLNKELGLSHGKIQRCLEALFGIKISRGASANSLLRTGRRCQQAYAEIQAAVRSSPTVVPDETGWKVGGRSAWMHVLVGKEATYYQIAQRRGAEVAQGVLGRDWKGALIHDGWSPYDSFKQATHQQCLDHLRRRCQRILLSATRGAVHFPRRILQLIEMAFAIRRKHEAGAIDADSAAMHGLALTVWLEELASGRFTYEPNQRLAKHLKRHIWQWFWFLIEPGLDATNWQAEQAIRPGVVNRKVWGGNRTWQGAGPQGSITSVLRTCAQRGRDGFHYLRRLLCSPHPVPLPSAKQ